MRITGIQHEVSNRRRWERGGAAMLVAILLGGGVLLGVSALTLDVGNIWWERRQLQNAADSASLALAAQCASAPAACATNSPVIATYSNLNVKDGSTSNDGVCGRFGSGFTPSTAGGAWVNCPSAIDNATTQLNKAANLAECLPLPAWLTGAGAAYSYVEVRAGTSTGGSTPTLLPGIFSRAVTGSDDPHVSSCARAAWGPASPSSQQVLNIVMSECDWKTQTGYTGPGTATYPSGPVGPKPGYTTGTWPSSETRVYTKGNPTSCDTSSPGGTAPGGFAALHASSNCQSTLTVGSDGKLWSEGDPGNDLPCSDTQLMAMRGTVVYLPIFDCQTDAPVTVISTTDCASGNGSHNYYRISGFAAFYLAGWRLSGTSVDSIRPPNAAACSGGDRCLVGWFLKDVVASIPPTTPPTGGSPNYGLTGVWPGG